MDMEGETPYFYGSHYSNLGSVLHFLLRVEPFTQYFLEFQGGRFDIPDRSFHSIQQAWYLSSCYSITDVKEVKQKRVEGKRGRGRGSGICAGVLWFGRRTGAHIVHH